MERSAFAASNQHGRVGIVDQLMKTLDFPERGDLGVGRLRSSWIELWVRHDGGLR